MSEKEQDNALRPLRFADFAGQAKIVSNLKIFVEAAKLRGESLDHVLLFGPPGLGKTTLSNIIANELGVGFKVTSGPVLAKPGDLAGLLTSLEPGDVLVPDAWSYPKTLKAVVWYGNGRRFAGECSCGEKEATLTTPLTEDTIMENAEHKELELLLSFELERRPITIADLEDITPGHAFPLDCGTDSPVTIRANGKAVALGRVVDMGGTLGVQILQKM